MAKKQPKQFNLTGGTAGSAAGLLRFAKAAYRSPTRNDRRVAVNLMMAWPITRAIAHKLLKGEISVTVADNKEDISFTV